MNVVASSISGTQPYGYSVTVGPRRIALQGAVPTYIISVGRRLSNRKNVPQKGRPVVGTGLNQGNTMEIRKDAPGYN